MALTLRPVTEGELDTFAGFVVGLYQDDPGGVPMTLERAKRQVASVLAFPHRARPMLIMFNEVPIGHLILVPYWSNEFGGDIVWLDEIFVLPEHRRHGIGTAVLARLQKMAAEEGWWRIELEAHRRNQRALAVYARAGFEVEDRVLCGWQRVRPG